MVNVPEDVEARRLPFHAGTDGAAALMRAVALHVGDAMRWRMRHQHGMAWASFEQDCSLRLVQDTLRKCAWPVADLEAEPEKCDARYLRRLAMQHMPAWMPMGGSPQAVEVVVISG
jgi:hypothetical protein